MVPQDDAEHYSEDEDRICHGNRSSRSRIYDGEPSGNGPDGICR